jgi:hypothetical protein
LDIEEEANQTWTTEATFNEESIIKETGKMLSPGMKLILKRKDYPTEILN